MKLNLEPWDYSGPMVYNESMRKHIKENGKGISDIDFVVDEESPKFSIDMNILHVPSGKVNGYSACLDLDRNLRVFDGFGGPAVEDDKEDFLVMYESDFVPAEAFRSFNDERLDKILEKGRSENLKPKEIRMLVEEGYGEYEKA